MLRELDVWSRLKHENILLLLGFTTNFGDLVALVSPWHPGGTATTYVRGKSKETLLNIASALNVHMACTFGLSTKCNSFLAHVKD